MEYFALLIYGTFIILIHTMYKAGVKQRQILSVCIRLLFGIPIDLVNLPNLPFSSAKLKRNYGYQMVTHVSIVTAVACLTLLI